MRARKPSLNEGQRRWIREWWKALQPPNPDETVRTGELAVFNRGTRALLRRAWDVETLEVQRAVFVLARGLIRRGADCWPLRDESSSYGRIALVAGVLSHVMNDLRDGETLAGRLGKPVAGGRPLMTELRFQNLLRARDASDLFQQWRRAVQLAPETDVARLADDLLTWLAELRAPSPASIQAHDSVKFHWAYDYYLASNPEGAKVSQDPVSDEEINA